MTALEKTGSGSVESEDFNSLVDAVASLQGAVVVHAFPFAYNTAGLNDGVVVHTPAVGDILVLADIVALTVFNGTTPCADIGTFVGTTTGFLEASGVHVSHLDSLSPQGGWLSGYAGSHEYGLVWRAGTTDPLKLVVSRDGLKGGTAIGGTTGSAILYYAFVTPAS